MSKLEWKDIDFRRRTIKADNKADHHTKNYEPRSIPINDFLYTVLKKIPRHFKSDFVYYNSGGERFGKVDKGLKAALRRAGIESFGSQNLRHTFASLLVMKGCDLRTVQQLLGHMDIKMSIPHSHLIKNTSEMWLKISILVTIWTPRAKLI